VADIHVEGPVESVERDKTQQAVVAVEAALGFVEVVVVVALVVQLWPQQLSAFPTW
jgi:hypothetical protein